MNDDEKYDDEDDERVDMCIDMAEAIHAEALTHFGSLEEVSAALGTLGGLLIGIALSYKPDERREELAEVVKKQALEASNGFEKIINTPYGTH